MLITDPIGQHSSSIETVPVGQPNMSGESVALSAQIWICAEINGKRIKIAKNCIPYRFSRGGDSFKRVCHIEGAAVFGQTGDCLWG